MNGCALWIDFSHGIPSTFRLRVVHRLLTRICCLSPGGERGWRCCCRVSLAYRHHSSGRELHKRNYTGVDKSVDNCEMLRFVQFTGLNFSLACLWLSVPLDQWGTFL